MAVMSKSSIARQRPAHLPRTPAIWSDWTRQIFLTSVMVSLATFSAAGAVIQCDLCIFGGTSAGVIAAVQAAKLGKMVVIVW